MGNNRVSVRYDTGLRKDGPGYVSYGIREISHIDVYSNAYHHVIYGVVALHVKLGEDSADFFTCNDYVIWPFDQGKNLYFRKELS